MPPLSFMFKTPTPLRYSEQHILGTNTGVMCLPFFFLLLQLTIERLRVILHSALLCCPVLTLTPGIPLGQAVMHLAAQCGAAQLFLNTISNFNCPDNSFKFLWFAFVDSKFEVSLEFISVLQKFLFFFFLGVLSAMISSVYLYPPIQSKWLSSFEKFLKSSGHSSLVFQGHGRLFCLSTSIFSSSYN